MQILNKTSLAKTIDNVNEAFFYDKEIPRKEAVNVIRWICSQEDTPYSYAGSFGVTASDMKGKVYTFTGEPLTSPASMRHIMAEEASRVLIQLSKLTGKKVAALKSANEKLLKNIKYAESLGKRAGTYCCGPCTVGLWRHLTVGGFGSYSKNLPKGVEVLKKFRDGKGAWGRFPFYYTLLTLSEIDHPAARNELSYAKPAIEKKLRRVNKNSKFSQRRHDLLLKILD
jgi:hypothetical protein